MPNAQIKCVIEILRLNVIFGKKNRQGGSFDFDFFKIKKWVALMALDL